MPINASIPLGIQPMQLQFQKPESKVNMLAQVLQLQQAESGNKLNSLKLQQVERDLATETAIGEAWRDAMGPDGTPDRNRLISTLATKGYGAKIPGIQKQFMDADKARFDTQKAAFENYKNFQLTLGSQFNNPNLSRESVLATVTPMVESGAMDRTTALRMLQTLPEDPQQLRAYLRSVITTQMTPEQMLTAFAPKPTQVDNGQQISFRDTNPNSPTYGQVTGGSPVQKVADPGAVLSAQTSTANNQRSVAAQRDIAQATRDAAATNKQAAIESARIQTGFQNEQGLRKEFEALPEVKKYKQAVPSYKGIEDAVTRNTAQSDINIVYGIAKLYDPDSVVREGEYATVANSPNIPDRIKGYAQYLAGGGRLTPKVKNEILAEARSRMASFENEFVAARRNFESIANRSQVDTTRVFPAPHTPALSVDLNSLPSGSGGGGRPKVVDFGSLK